MVNLRHIVCLPLLALSVTLPAQLSFTNVAGTGADASNVGYIKDGGCAFADYDRDGDLDLLVNTYNNSAAARCFLLRNDNGVYKDVTATVAPNLKSNLAERSASWGDCNNDGYPDFLVNTYDRIQVYLNNGGTGFTRILNITTMTDGMNSEGAGWMDYDNDGDLDFFVECHNFGVDLFRNDGNTLTPGFTQVTINSVGAAGTGAGGLGLPEGGSTAGDYSTSSDINGDGYVDLIARRINAGTNTGTDLNTYDMFLNQGNGTFAPNTAFNEQTSEPNKGGVSTGDFDNDGDFDLLWTSASTDGDKAVIYQQTGLNSGNFVLVANPFKLDNNTSETATDFDGCTVGDVDNDGDLDIFMSQNSGPSKLFLNNSTGPGSFAFRQAGPTWIPGAAINYGINVNNDGEGCIFADYDNDGDLDLYVNINGSANQLWRNNYIGSATEAAATYQNSYVRVIPMLDHGGGVFSPAINATVRLLDCDGNSIGGVREVGGGDGHGTQKSPWLHFGLKYGPDRSYLLEVQFTRNGTTPVVVRKAIIPSDLPLLQLGTSILTMEQTVVIRSSDANDQSACVDTDADGTPDAVDLDDDNDGIPDNIEGCGELIANGSFETDDFTDPVAFPNGFTGSNGTFIGTTYNTNTLTGWNYDLNLDGWVSGGGYGSNLFAPAFHGRQYIDIVGSSSSTGGIQTKLWQMITTEPGKEYTLSFHWGEDIGHSAGQPVDIIAKVIDATNVELVDLTENIFADGNIASVIGPKRWYHVTANFIATSSQTKILFTCTQPAGSPSGAGADLDLVSVTLANMAACADTDADGVPDALDLDSDNDGIYDLVEAGHGATDANNDGIIDGTPASFGSNGLANSLETTPDSNVINYVIQDSDNDGIRDAAETDSDDDGCYDVTEAGFTDADADGEVDGSGITPNGKVTGSDGYTGTNAIVTDYTHVAPICDTDGDGINPTVDLDDDNDGIPDNRECLNNFQWSSPPSTSGNTATGSIYGINYTYTSSSPVETTGGVYSHATFPASFGVPNTNPTIKNSQVTTNTLNFGVPIKDPILVFASIGAGFSVPIDFSDPVEILFSQAVVQNTPTRITGTEGYAILRMNGTFTTISFNYTVAENYCNFVFGADFVIYCDTDNDGIPNHLDLDSDNDGIYDLVEAGHGAADVNNDGIIDGAPASFGANGFFNALESAIDNGVLNYTIKDSDGDGYVDSTELDSDGDGCYDVIEAGFTDANGDGELGPVPLAVDLNGVVISGGP